MPKGQKKDYTYKELRDEREYGFYWYSALWRAIRPVIVVGCALLVVIGLLSSVWGKIYGEYLAPVDTGDAAEVTFQVASGDSLTRVATNLEESGLIRSKTLFKYYCDFAGMGQKIQPGTFRLTRAMTMGEIANQLTTGDGNPMVRNVTMIPGWTVEDLAAKLFTDGVITDQAAFLELCRAGAAFQDFYYVADLMKTPNLSQRKYALEGYLSPNTYEVYTNATPEEILRKMLSQTERTFSQEVQDRAEELGMTLDQVLTLASLIEKEAKKPDFARVSAVFHNRIRDKMPLGSDVTIHYITGVRKMALSGDDLKAQSLYNTYLHQGLPLGPICSPSSDAIQAAVYPDEQFVAEKYLYFCSKDPESGELHFSRTLKEHEQAVAIYAPLWRQYDQSRGIQ